MKIRSVAVLGVGAVGAYILYGLSQTKDVDFCVVADGARKERLESSAWSQTEREKSALRGTES